MRRFPGDSFKLIDVFVGVQKPDLNLLKVKFQFHFELFLDWFQLFEKVFKLKIGFVLKAGLVYKIFRVMILLTFKFHIC